MKKLFFSLFSTLYFLIRSNAFAQILFVGSYTDTIHILEFDKKKGALHRISTTVGFPNTSFLKYHNNTNTLFATLENEVGEVASFSYSPFTHQLTHINTLPSYGAHPCHLAISPSGHLLSVANYNGGNFSVYRVEENGKLTFLTSATEKGSGIFPQQEASHVHFTNFLWQSDEFLASSNLGADKISVYEFNTNNDKSHLVLQEEIILEAGSGPRHFAFAPKNNLLFVLSELSGKIDVFKLEKKHKATKLFSIEADLSAAPKPKRSADIHVTKNEKFLYATLREPSNQIVVYEVQLPLGILKEIQRLSTGSHPRNFSLSLDEKWLLVANKNENSIQIFKRNTKSGTLSESLNSISVALPVCLEWGY